MTMRCTKQTAANAEGRLLELIREYGARGEVRLPGYPALARQAGVSVRRLAVLLARLSSRNIVTIVARRGVFLTAHQLPQHSSGYHCSANVNPGECTATVAAKMLNRMEQDIAQGVYPPGELLPSCKELHHTYRGGPTTIRSCLDALTRLGILEEHGRRKRVPGIAAALRRGTIPVIAVTDEVQVLSTMSPRAPFFWQTLEYECRKRNVAIEICSLLPALKMHPWPEGKTLSLNERFHGKNLLGYMVWTMGMSIQSIAHLIPLLDASKPVSILHDNPDPSFEQLRDMLLPWPQVTVYTHAVSPRCGEQMARTLFSLGHRSIALFSHTREGWLWNVRAAGIERFFQQSGVRCTVGRYWPPEAIDWQFYSRLGQKIRHHHGLAQLVKMYPFLGGTPNDSYVALVKSSSPIGDQHLIDNHLQPWFMLNAFRNALAEGGATAWVGLSDRFALLASQFLRAHGVPIPGDISVVGFDNSAGAIESGLSSYDFNIPALVTAMLRHILGPRSARRTQRRWIEIEGSVVMRATLGPCPPAPRDEGSVNAATTRKTPSGR